MKPRIHWMIGLILALLMVGLVRAQDATPEATPEATAEVTPESTPNPKVEFPGPGGYTLHGPIGRFPRVYRVYIPKAYGDGEAAVPLLFVFHGAGGTGRSIASMSAFNDVADREDFVAVYPDGINAIWNDDRPPNPIIGPVDDVAFVSAMIETLTNSLNIDSQRIYAAGYSAGGMFSYRLGCELPDQMAAVASVASTFPQYLSGNCDRTPPIPLLVIQGTDDPIIPWMGYPGGYLSAAETLHYWGDHNGCTTSSGPTLETDTDPDDGTFIALQARGGCTNDADVVLYGVFYGGHTWPNHPIKVNIELGRTSMDIDASQAIWDFFKVHPKV